MILGIFIAGLSGLFWRKWQVTLAELRAEKLRHLGTSRKLKESDDMIVLLTTRSAQIASYDTDNARRKARRASRDALRLEVRS
jgi:hypothetical protein